MGCAFLSHKIKLSAQKGEVKGVFYPPRGCLDMKRGTEAAQAVLRPARAGGHIAQDGPHLTSIGPTAAQPSSRVF